MPENTEKPEVIKESGGYELVESGFLLTFNEKSSIDLTLCFSDNEKLRVSFEFEQDSSGKQGVDTDVDADTETLYIKCKNFKNRFGAGTKQALKLGRYKDKDVYMCFWIYDLGTLKKVEYCFFIEK